MKVNPKRIRILSRKYFSKGPVLYWMSREQRVCDNWALLFALQLAREKNTLTEIVFCLSPQYPRANQRHYAFMIEGLKEIEKELFSLNIPFHVLCGYPPENLGQFASTHKNSAIVTDFDPLRIKKKWKSELVKTIDVPVYEVDAHNIVPAFLVSSKQEFGAYTLRPKINRLLPEFLEEFPVPEVLKKSGYRQPDRITWNKIWEYLRIDRTVHPVEGIIPGMSRARKVLTEFLDRKLEKYGEKKNDPNQDVLSGLSPYIHFGQISAQRVAQRILKGFGRSEVTIPFLEELIVRKELSDNYCLYNPYYDQFRGFPRWARKTLNEHRKDQREYEYSTSDFESASTHDELWNAAQKEMRATGKMHGYMRMYWAKKILEWSKTPEKALETSIYLNDKYQIDGRDPNGFAGCSWAVGGLHDRAWKERPVFGKIRYMNYNGCKRKFDVEAYIERNKA